MALSWIRRLMMKKLHPVVRSSRNAANRHRLMPNLELLNDRIVPAVSAMFIAPSGALSIFGDAGNNSIVISRDAAGKILVNNGAVSVFGGTPTVANTQMINVFGLGGNDNIALNEANGALPKSQLFGGAGNDTLTGGSGADMLFGESGNDSLLGKGGVDLLFGGADNDVLTGGVGDDQVFGEAGNDRMIWNPGEGSDLNEGGAGNDTVEVNGGNGAETFTLTANGSRVRFDRLNPAPFFVDIGTSENVVLNANGGNDFFSATGNLAALTKITVDGGAGNDTLLGSNGNDLLVGGDDNDFIDGNQGNDTAMMGAGNDTFQWDPGDGSDVVEGQAGADAMIFNGANIGEIFDMSANGDRVRFTRNIGNITMDVNDIERIDLNALGGADRITIGDLSSTDVTQVNVDLAAVVGSGTGDIQADVVTVNGTKANDQINLLIQGTSVSVLGLPAVVSINGAEGANDSLNVKALDGNDGVSALALPAGIVKLTLDGGDGNDALRGSQGDDVLLGGDGNDFIIGNRGNDIAFMGGGEDIFQWAPGDGSDTVEGEAGTDQLFFFGANLSENFAISANGPRVSFTRDVGNITMDLNGTEQIELRTLAGADNIVINDLTGTDMTRIELALRGPMGGGDNESDSITVNATQSADNFSVAGDIGGVRIIGLQAEVRIFDHEPELDQLTVNGLGGSDIVDAKSLRSASILLAINGGSGDDTVTGSDGSDVISGGQGADVVFMGDGDDTFVWNPGDGNDIVEGQDGVDTMLFNGANISENIEMSSNGGRLRFTRNVASITMDANGLEHVIFNALGGADNIVVNDLSGTDVDQVDLNLAATGGVGDGQADTVTVSGTASDDVVMVAGDANGVSVFGLATQVNITGAEAANDRLVVKSLAGDDVVQASSLTIGTLLFTADGGDNDDVLIGGPGNDTLLGGLGDDVLIGNGGLDLLDGGPGDNILIP